MDSKFDFLYERADGSFLGKSDWRDAYYEIHCRHMSYCNDPVITRVYREGIETYKMDYEDGYSLTRTGCQPSELEILLIEKYGFEISQIHAQDTTPYVYRGFQIVFDEEVRDYFGTEHFPRIKEFKVGELLNAEFEVMLGSKNGFAIFDFKIWNDGYIYCDEYVEAGCTGIEQKDFIELCEKYLKKDYN